MDGKFIIPLNGLAVGGNRFFWHAGKEFFDSFENEEIFNADLQIEVFVEKSGRYIGVDCEVDGWVTVQCDRCLEMLEMPIETDISLSVKFGEAEPSDEIAEGEREVIFVPQTDAELDMGQIVYDYVCLSLPMQRVHQPGGCNPDAMRYLEPQESVDTGSDIADSNPFAALKDMFK